MVNGGKHEELLAMKSLCPLSKYCTLNTSTTKPVIVNFLDRETHIR